MDRRDFMSVSGLGLAALAAAAPGEAAELTELERANLKVVTDFCASWSMRDLSRVVPFLTDDAVYRMSETTPPVVGPAGVEQRLGSWMESSQRIEFKILDSYAKGPIVITHRVDTFASTTRPLTWEGVGVFFIKDGRIKEWSDYTIRVERRP